MYFQQKSNIGSIHNGIKNFKNKAGIEMKKALTLILMMIFVIGTIRAEEKPVIVSHYLEMVFNLDEHTFKAADELAFINGGDWIELLLNKDFKVEKIAVQGNKTKFKRIKKFDYSKFSVNLEKSDSLYFQRGQLLRIKNKFKLERQVMVRIEYSGFLYDTVSTAQFSRSSVADQTVGIISAEGIYLSPEALYYADNYSSMAEFKACLTVPADYLTVTDGKLTENKEANGWRTMLWEGEAATDGLYISGAKWEMIQDKAGKVEIYGLFFKEDQSISEQYVGAVKQYIEMYNGLLGEYPYSKFAVAENFFSTGYGMPSWTLLGREVVRLPWIVDISLGHEVCHNWWGNGVFVDYDKGNWCEGLTTYCADYLYKERKDTAEARLYRRSLDQDYTNYVNEGNDFALSEFRSREETFTRAIGYGKSAMVFHMLRQQIGDRHFWQALGKFYADNKFKQAGWKEIQKAFEAECGCDLAWFFRQWVEGKGAPQITLEKAEYVPAGENSHIALEIKQPYPFENLQFKIKQVYKERENWVTAKLSPGINSIKYQVSEKPSAVILDPGFDLFRLLDRGEYPASLSEVLGDAKQAIVLPTGAEEALTSAYRELVQTLNRTGEAAVLNDRAVKAADLKDNSYLILGKPGENRLYTLLEQAGLKLTDWIIFHSQGGGFNLMGQSFNGEVSFMTVMRNPANVEHSIALFGGNSADEILRSGKKLVHYGKYSYLAFDKGANQMKGNWEVTDSPLKREFK